ncbi:MAG: sodium-dependent transporter [Kiritimatiellae bacterium]|nr:sodium-dependent transporter [Kiritimatiellia bacterium]
MEKSETSTRATLTSRLGFLMLAAGCAVGLGNVWRFPYVTGANGGAAFVLVYLFFLAILGFPLLMAELAVGRGAQKGIAGALAALAPSRWSKAWGALGLVLFAGNFLLMIYYTDVSGWLLNYTGGYLRGVPSPEDPSAAFKALVSDTTTCTAYMLLAVAVATGICLAGVVKGVERATKFMMLSLLALLVVLAVKAVSLPGAKEGLVFYLAPDWTKFMSHPVKSVFDAMGQAFFTLSLGIGAMTIFGSYTKRTHSLVSESLWIIVIDTFVALLAGFIIFPACAAYKVPYTSGPGLIFVALPKVFASMPGGRMWGFAFFLFLSFAALTTIVAVFECLIGGVMDEWKLKRARAVLLVGAGVAACSLPCVLFEPVLGWEDFAVSQLWLPLGGLSLSLFVTRQTFGWGWENFRTEVSTGRGFRLPAGLYPWMAWGVPILIFALLVGGLVQL